MSGEYTDLVAISEFSSGNIYWIVYYSSIYIISYIWYV